MWMDGYHNPWRRHHRPFSHTLLSSSEGSSGGDPAAASIIGVGPLQVEHGFYVALHHLSCI